MQLRQTVELNQGSYEILEEIGVGASSRVYLVQRHPPHLIQLPTQPTNTHHNDGTPLTPVEDMNPDLLRF